MQIKEIKQGYILHSDKPSSTFSFEQFEASYWEKNDAIVGAKKGRATAWFFQHNNLICVLKHYWRGGLIGKLLSDQYLYTKLENTRVYREFELMCELQKHGLPVPTPIAARIIKSKLVYRADLITAAIPEAQSVCELLTTQSLSEKQLQDIAKTIADFHRAGIYHADLNINNILFNGSGKVFLIDFDRGEIKKPDANWQKSNLDRLKRSFLKEASKAEHFFFTEEHWLTLYRYYQAEIMSAQ